MLDPTGTHLISGILPRRQVSILAGASGAGKSTLLFQIIAALQRNEPVFENDVVPDLRIGYIKGERTWELEGIIQAERAGVDPARLPIWSLGDDPDPVLIKSMQRDAMTFLKGRIQAMLPLDLLIIDPLVVFFGVDANAYHATSLKLLEITHWCREFDITILGTHHASKARTDFTYKRPQDRILGSAALLGFSANHLFLLEPEEDNATYQFHVLDHTQGSQVHMMTRLPKEHPTQPGIFIPWHPEAEPVFSGQDILAVLPETQSVTKAFLVESLPNYSPTQLDGALRDLLNAGLINRAGHGRIRRAALAPGIGH